jgi:hypothetical protein
VPSVTVSDRHSRRLSCRGVVRRCGGGSWWQWFLAGVGLVWAGVLVCGHGCSRHALRAGAGLARAGRLAERAVWWRGGVVLGRVGAEHGDDGRAGAGHGLGLRRREPLAHPRPVAGGPVGQ